MFVEKKNKWTNTGFWIIIVQNNKVIFVVELEDETFWWDLMWGMQVYCFELPICCYDSETPKGKFVLPNYLLLFCSPDSFQVCVCLCVHLGDRKRADSVYVHWAAAVCESLYVRGSLHGCLRVNRQTPSGQSQIKPLYLFVAFEEDCVCHLPGANAMLT